MKARYGTLVLIALLLTPVLAGAFQPKSNNDSSSLLSSKEFFVPELYLSSSQVSLQDFHNQLLNQTDWNNFFAKNGSEFQVYFDPRSGIPVNIIGHIPMIPGSGSDNKIGLDSISSQLKTPVKEITSDVVAKVFRNFVADNVSAFGIDLKQLGEIHATKVNDYLWYLSAFQQVNGIPVRWSRFAGTINHGNLVIVGAENWGNVKINTKPTLTAQQAMNRGFNYAGAHGASDQVWLHPKLEIIPVAPARYETAGGYSGPVGSGYEHRLAWVFGFQRPPEAAKWMISVDAKTGEVLEMADKNDYIDKRFVGNTYPLTDTGICPTNDTCGLMEPGSPMPFVDTGFASPNNFTNSAGIYDYTSGTATTHLSGKYVDMTDTCGSINATSATGDIDLGGVNGQHDCTLPAPGGVTSAVRSGAFELNKIFEEARGWLPSNPWLNGNQTGPLPANMNISLTCNAFYSSGDPGSVNFYKSGGGCNNTGEIAAVFDHEWGHGMDDHDGNGLSNSSEGYADIASMYRLWASCVGFGFFQAGNQLGCGDTTDGTGSNNDEAQQGASHCDTDCSGVRDSDWAKHTPNTPDTVTFTCASCVGGGGPCGTQVHCAATPVRQAAWDFVARDLQGAPFNYDKNTSFIVGDKTFYQGSGNVGAWHSCTCPSTSSGCAATNGYMGWITADDDNGNLNDGTPHMTAIFAAYNRHGIACATPTPTNAGCAGGPTVAPSITVLPGNNSVTVSWSAVAGATTYNVFRGEGFAGCDFGKALIGSTASTSFEDTEVANDRDYAYVVMAQGSDSSCYSPASACSIATPQPCVGVVVLDKAKYSCSSPIGISLGDSDLSGGGTHNVTAKSTTETTPETVTLSESPANSGKFNGSITATPNPPLPANGLLSLNDGDTITVTYHDDSFCGPPQDVIATATADCVAASISNVASSNISFDSATVTWNTNELANSEVLYAPAPAPPSTSVSDAAFTTSHSVNITGLTGCTLYNFDVSSDDVAGNTATDNNGGSHYTFTTQGLGFLLVDDVESGSSDWIAAGPAGSTFHIDTCKSHSASHAWKAGSTTCPGTYGSNVATTLTSANSFTIEATSQLNFWENYVTQSSSDLNKPQISTDGGATWTNIDSYSGNSGGWQFKSYNLGSFAGANRKIRFLFTSNTSVAFEGWYIDDIQVTHSEVCGANLAFKGSSATDSCGIGGAGDNNGVLDPGETATLHVTTENLGSVNATGISAHLTTATPGVTIPDADATFGDTGSGATTTADFTISLANTVACGSSISFHIAYTTDQGTFSDDFTVPVGSATFVTTNFNPTDVPKNIPDNGSTSSTINVTDTHPLQDINVTLNIQHPSDADLDLFLNAPGGTPSVELSTDNGGTGDNYTNTVLDDQAAASITSGTPPFTGTFHPEGNLNSLTGLAANGAWTLSAADDSPANSGILLSWSLKVTTSTGASCNACTACPTITVSPATLPNGALNAAYNATLTASGGTSPYTFAVTSGALPTGLTLSSAGVISGSPTTAATFNFTITATDNGGCGGSQAYTVIIGTCLFCDDFEDGVLALTWVYDKPTSWTEPAGGNLIAAKGKKNTAIATPAFGGCSNCYVESTMSSAGKGSVSMFGWYVDKKNNVELLMKEKSDKWYFKERINGHIKGKATVKQTIDAATFYRARITFDGTTFTVSVDGITIATVPSQGAHTGTVGFQAKKTIASFGEVIVN